MTQIEQSQKEFMAWAENAEAFRTPQCIHGFGDSDCAYPGCKCLAMPIKADRWPNIEFSGDESEHNILENRISRYWTQEQHADHLEATREPRSPSHFRPLVKYCLASALLVTLGAVLFWRILT